MIWWPLHEQMAWKKAMYRLVGWNKKQQKWNPRVPKSLLGTGERISLGWFDVQEEAKAALVIGDHLLWQRRLSRTSLIISITHTSLNTGDRALFLPSVWRIVARPLRRKRRSVPMRRSRHPRLRRPLRRQM